jgi:hypothetical protein
VNLGFDNRIGEISEAAKMSMMSQVSQEITQATSTFQVPPT